MFLINRLCSLLILQGTLIACGNDDHQSNKDSISQKNKQAPVLKLTEKQERIINGAKQCLEKRFSYDSEMAYHVLEYHSGEHKGRKIYPEGDLDPKLGVCTDVTIRALRYAGIVDLQEAVHEDIMASWRDYPMKRWDSKKPDTNIDHRRVPNQFVWFRKHWDEVLDGIYMPGDVVVWDMDSDSWADHLGIISDKSPGGHFWVIHNFPDPGYVAEEDIIGRWKISGVFRVKE